MKKLLLAILFTIISGCVYAQTIPNDTPLKNVYSCNGSTTQFPYGFPISATSDMTVYVTDNNGNVTDEPSSTFSVDTSNVWVNYPLTGSPCPTGYMVTLLPSTPQTQTTSYGQRTPFTASAVGASLNKLTIITQQLQEQLNRALLAPVSSTNAATLPGPSNGSVLGWTNGILTNLIPNTNAYITTSTDGTMGGASPSDGLIPTQKAVNTYVTTSLGNGYATAGANSNITSLSGISTPLSTNQGGTGKTANANAANGVVVLNGSTQLPAVSGVLLTSIPLVSQTPLPYIKCTNTQNSGTGGGDGINSTWTIMPLNTKDTDTASIATLTSNQITLPAGTYLVKSSASFGQNGDGGPAKIRIYNVTTSTDLIDGQNSGWTAGVSSGDGTFHGAYSVANGLITLTATNTIEIQYYVINLLDNSNDLGEPIGSGSNEVYAMIELTKVK